MAQELNPKEYLNQLLEDKTTVTKIPKIFLHLERLLDEEINRVRNDIFCPSNFRMPLVKSSGPVVKLTEKVYAKVKDHPKFNFVGRLIGPRGLTLRQIEEDTGAKLLVRGRGSMKDKKAEEEKKGQPNFEHLDEDLHALLIVEDTEERARSKLQKAVEQVKFLLTPPKDGEDDIKKKQLQDLAILNGSYRPPGSNNMQGNVQQQPNNGMQNPVLPNGLMNFSNHPPSMMPNSAAYPPHPPLRISTGSMKAHIAKVRSMYNSHPYNNYQYGGGRGYGYNSHEYNFQQYNSYQPYSSYPTTYQGISSERTDDNMVLEITDGENVQIEEQD